MVYPEMTRDAILFGGTDPGRFCPTYMIFCESFIAASASSPNRTSTLTAAMFTSSRRTRWRTGRTWNTSARNTTAARKLTRRSSRNCCAAKKETDDSYTTNWLARMAYQLLDKPFTKLGASIEARRRREGVYPAQGNLHRQPGGLERCLPNYLDGCAAAVLHDNDPQIVPGTAGRSRRARSRLTGEVDFRQRSR